MKLRILMFALLPLLFLLTLPLVAQNFNEEAWGKNSPGTAWCTCTPELVTRSRNGPRPDRIIRVISRVTRNVTTNAAKHRISGTLV